MKLLHKISIIFLGLISLEYIVLGVFTLLSLLIKSEPMLVLAAFMSDIYLVAPLSIVSKYGIKASCFIPHSCNLDAATIFNAQVIIGILGIFATIGGIMSFFGTILIWKKNKIGCHIWLFFVILSIGVALWNLKWFFFDSYYTNLYIGTISSMWALLYTVAYIFARQIGHKKPQSAQFSLENRARLAHL